MLSVEMQWDILWDKGVFLEHYISNETKYSLYALGNFFVEVELEPETLDIRDKTVFKYGDLLNKYTSHQKVKT